jgi:hypothetical protein
LGRYRKRNMEREDIDTRGAFMGGKRMEEAWS